MKIPNKIVILLLIIVLISCLPLSEKITSENAVETNEFERNVANTIGEIDVRDYEDGKLFLDY
jgi:hypothetical protein|tara:strand:- start:1010 stop:1198 length:189 start_codon:yes stop_codon:yes gene_type:complete